MNYKAKYLIYPGYVREKYVSFTELIYLYNLDPKECICFEPEYTMDSVLKDRLITLTVIPNSLNKKRYKEGLSIILSSQNKRRTKGRLANERILKDKNINKTDIIDSKKGNTDE